MPSIQTGKTFKIPFQGGAATIVVLVQCTRNGSNVTTSKVTQYNEDGTTNPWDALGDITLSVSLADGVMTVNIGSVTPNYTINDSRCCIIPGNPFV